MSQIVSLCEDHIPGSLAGRNPAELKTEELHCWLKCKNDQVISNFIKVAINNYIYIGTPIKQINYTS